MFEALAGFPWERCRSRYDVTRAIVEAESDDVLTRDRIFQILWEHGGRCDCTVGHKIVDVPEQWAAVRAAIEAVTAGPPLTAVEPLLRRQGWKPAIEPMGPARRQGETFVYDGLNRQPHAQGTPENG